MNAGGHLKIEILLLRRKDDTYISVTPNLLMICFANIGSKIKVIDRLKFDLPTPQDKNVLLVHQSY